MERRPHISLKDIGRVSSKLVRFVALPAILTAGLNTAVLADGGSVDPQKIAGHYTQCGGEVFGQMIPPDHTISVLRLIDGSYDSTDLGVIAGQCGNTFPAPEDLVSPFPNGTREGQPVSVGDAEGNTYPWNRTYPQCGGALGPMVFNPSHTLLVDEFTNPDLGNKYGVRDLGPLPGQCGNPS